MSRSSARPSPAAPGTATIRRLRERRDRSHVANDGDPFERLNLEEGPVDRGVRTDFGIRKGGVLASNGDWSGNPSRLYLPPVAVAKRPLVGAASPAGDASDVTSRRHPQRY
jgi:hypothetical protein